MLLSPIFLLARPASAADDYPYSADVWCNGQAAGFGGDCTSGQVLDGWGFYKKECTSFVAWRLRAAGATRSGVTFQNSWGSAPNGQSKFGNAEEWDTYAASLGYAVNGTPAIGAVAHWNANEGGAGSAGHVAIVSAVSVDGSVTIEEFNYGVSPNTHRYGTRTGVRAPRYLHIQDTNSGGNPSSAAVPRADFNGDGKSDIAWYESGINGGQITGLYSNGSTLATFQPMNGPAVGTSSVGKPDWAGVGDFNGDGKSDIAWYESGINGGQITGLYSNGSTLATFQPMNGPAVGTSSVGKPDWAGRGSFAGTNGDGSAHVPGGPRNVAATAGNTTASIAFLPPTSDGGLPITSYSVTSSPGGVTATGAASPITVAGLTNGVAYTFTVRASNAATTSAASSPSNPVTPSAPTDGRIHGVVTGPSGSVLGAVVRLYPTGRATPTKTVPTEADGSWSTPLATGSYKVQIVAANGRLLRTWVGGLSMATATAMAVVPSQNKDAGTTTLMSRR